MDNEYLKNILEINEISKERNLAKNLEALDIVSNSLSILVNSLYVNKVKMEYHHSEIESKFFRYVISNQSIIKLFKGLNFQLLNKRLNIIDIFSIKSIMRYQIESYLVMFHLFFDDLNTSELDLRYNIYKLHALNKQMTFAKNGEYAKKKAKEVQKEIESIKQNIVSSSKYQSSNSKAKEKLLNPKKAIPDRENLFEDSGLNKVRISDMWSIYSNYAHSEHISDRQFNCYYKLKTEDLNSDCVLSVEINLILTTRLALMLCKRFECCEKDFNKLSLREKAYINLWGKLH